MANEAVKRYDESSGYGGVIQDYTVADAIGIEKGTLLMLADPRTASGSVTLRAPMAGIAAREKVANDGRTQLSLYKKGYFDVLCSGAIPIGESVCAAGHGNQVIGSNGLNSGSQIMGYMDKAGVDKTVCLMRLNL